MVSLALHVEFCAAQQHGISIAKCDVESLSLPAARQPAAQQLDTCCTAAASAAGSSPESQRAQ